MRRLLLALALTPMHLLHELGTGRALDNARRDRDELAHTIAAVEALAARIASAVAPLPASADLAAA